MLKVHAILMWFVKQVEETHRHMWLLLLLMGKSKDLLGTTHMTVMVRAFGIVLNVIQGSLGKFWNRGESICQNSVTWININYATTEKITALNGQLKRQN